MTIPASLSKLKSLFPVFVVGASVAITIKLLTESTPLTSEILQVKAEEDIFSPEYKEELEEIKEQAPEPPKEETPPASEAEEEKNKEQSDESKPKEEVDSEKKNEQKDSSEGEKQNQEQPEQKPKPSGRAFISGGMGDILRRIIKPDKK